MIDGLSVMAFIPAKTNSVGLPGKLFKKIGGYSLFCWTLYAAYKSKYVDEIVVSTNDDKIDEEMKYFEYHAVYDLGLPPKKLQFIRRPNELCTPTSKTEEAITRFFNEFYSYRLFNYMVLLQATSPMRYNNLLDKCIEECVPSFDSLITVEKQTPFFWRKNSETQSVYPTYSLRNRPMRQELQDDEFAYKDNGNIYITKVSKYLQNKIRVSGNVHLHETDKFASMQIDTQDDFDLMECVYNKFGAFL